MKGYIHSLEYYLPEFEEYNSREDKTTEKIGIYSRHIAKLNESASDLAIAAATKLFEKEEIDYKSVDFLIYCTQSPDYILPTSACIIQSKLGLSTTCGALDVNLGCSGYVYGLSLAKGLIESGSAQNVLLLTGDTYSKYINKKDRSVKVIFGDAGSATLISAIESNRDLIGPFTFGTDGAGAKNLIIPAGGVKEPISEASFLEAADRFGNVRSRMNLYMNGPEIFNFTLKEIPSAVQTQMEKSCRAMEDYDFLIFHQANKYMLEHLQKKLKIEGSKFPIDMQNYGNTVSSTIPIVLKNLLDNKQINEGNLLMLVGFGVGYSWATCNVVWQN
ncbi:3-oxoacyl-ACP synthase III family protein [Cohnella cellulosilytica]|uniref:3-oxoacyl-ACP synthase III family protein n=1 Tax=Cohnella cellulosilytica TaxID=986710 RepID=A0ABW2FAE7_9BACL